MRSTLLSGTIFLAISTIAASSQAPKLKVHISVDMEGIAGVVTGDQLGPSGFEYGRFREFMTKEAFAAVAAAGPPARPRLSSPTRTATARTC